MSEALLTRMLPLDTFMASSPVREKKKNSLFVGGTDEPMEEFTCSLEWRQCTNLCAFLLVTGYEGSESVEHWVSPLGHFKPVGMCNSVKYTQKWTATL